MKKFIGALSLILMLALNVSAQQDTTEMPHALIYLLRTKSFVGSAVPSYIHFQNQQVFELPVGSIVRYTIYSEGEISIAAEYAGQGSLYCNLIVKRGNTYFVYLNKGKFTQEKMESKEIKKVLDKPNTLGKREENIEMPINRASLKDIGKRDGKGQGTCFLISQAGFLITNFHCVEGAKEITVKGIDGDFTTKYGATVVASDPSNDLALLKLGNKNLKFNAPPSVIRGSGVAQAEKIYALGFPIAEAMGEEMKITEGIISSKSGIAGDISKFQISAAVNPGNSGGPLIDENGNLVGVIYAKSIIADNAGYAIKANYLKTFLESVEGYEIPVLVNTIKDLSLTEKVAEWKKYIFIIEAN